MTRLNPIQATEKNPSDTQFQRKFWGVVAISVLALMAYAYALSNLFKLEPATAVYIKMAIYVIAIGLAITSLILAFRRQVDLALTLIFYFLLIAQVTNPATTQGRTLNATFTMLVVGTLMIGWLLPRSEWRKNAAFLAGAFLLAWVFEWLDPSWRVVTASTGAVGPAVAVIFSVILFILVVREAWGGNIRIRVITAFTLVAMVSLGILGATTYINYRNQVREDIRQRLRNMVSIIALQQDADLHAAIQNAGDEEMDEYKQFKTVNAAIIATEPELVYIYTMRRNEQGEIYFVVDTGQVGDEDTAAVAEVYEDASPEMLAAFANGEVVVEKDFYTDEWGTFLSAYAPFYDADGNLEGVVGIDVAADTVLAKERTVLNLIFGTALVAMVLVTLLGFWLGNLFTRPIIELSQVAQQVSDGNLNARANVQSTDEIGDLARIFNATTIRLQKNLENLEQRVEERTKALEVSSEISRRLASILDPLQLAGAVVNEVQSAYNYYYAQIYLFDEAGENLALTAGTGEAGAEMMKRGHRLPKGRGLVGRAAEMKEAILVSDTSQDPNWLPNELLPDTKAEAVVPIIIGDKVLGVLDVQDDVVNDITPDDITLLESLAGQVAISLQNAESYANAEAALQEARSLVENAAEGIAILDLETELWADPNENFARTFGMTIEEMVQTGPKVMSPPTQPDGRDSTEKAIEMINTAMEKGSHRFEWVHIKKDGSEFDCEIGLVRMPGDRPRLRQSILEITERKQLEILTAQRARQQEAINTITQKIQSATTVEEAMQVAARELGHALGKRQTAVTLEPSALGGNGNAAVAE